jgi:hypothetical protein
MTPIHGETRAPIEAGLAQPVSDALRGRSYDEGALDRVFREVVPGNHPLGFL